MSESLDPKRIRHLLAAADAGSLTLAAETLGLSQPALSMSIKTLEQELGVALLERHRHGVRTTAFGDVLVGHARRVEAEFGEAALRLRQLKLAAGRTIAIGCGPSESSRLLPMALTRLQRTHPQIRVFVEYGLNESLMPLVARGDIAFALSSVPRNSTHAELRHQVLCVDSAVVVARVGHPLARRRVLTARDLAAYPWVLARRWELERNALDQLFAEAGLAPIAPEIETTSATLMKTIVAQSDFLTFVPREMIHWEERTRLLRPLNGIHSSWARQVGLTTRRDAALSEPGRLLVASLREIAAGIAAG
jgi:DNA-binding transcriptional LysR family regulator